jgi:1-acyl-sn-glycerol-3-phosphate acyltransferase
MKRYWLRSTLFNLAFYAFTAVACFLALPSYFVPRSAFLWVIRIYLALNTALERLILGLSYEVRGAENLPEYGCFIVAAKHQSAYETLKLHVLFEDPAVILKKELLSIPIWGGFLKKSDVIAIDRSSKEQAMNSIIEGAQRMKEQNRPIIIFPQGTRVSITDTPKEKPYKFGVARVYEATSLPVIPLALNTGYYYPKHGWLRRPGRVVFEFLPAIEPGLKREEFMKRLETELEEKSVELLQDARYAEKEGGSPLKAIILSLILLAALFGGYSWLWFKTAEIIQAQHEHAQIAGAEWLVRSPLQISGYPGPLRVTGGEEMLQNPEGSVHIETYTASGFPLPFLPIRLETGKIEIKSFRYAEPLTIDSAVLSLRITGLNSARIENSLIRIGEFTAAPEGKITLNPEGDPGIDLAVSLAHHEALLEILTQKGMVEERSALFINAGLSALSRDGLVKVPITIRERIVYAGPFAVAALPGGLNPASVSHVPATDTPPAPSP